MVHKTVIVDGIKTIGLMVEKQIQLLGIECLRKEVFGVGNRVKKKHLIPLQSEKTILPFYISFQHFQLSYFHKHIKLFFNVLLQNK